MRRSLDECDTLVRIPVFKKTADRKHVREGGKPEFSMFQTSSIDSATGGDGEEIFGSDDVLAFLSAESIITDNIDEKIDADKAVKALKQLRPVDRQVLTLRLLRQMGFNEIGPIVGRSHQGVRNSYDRGMKKLRKILGAPQIENEDVGVCSKIRGPRRKARI